MPCGFGFECFFNKVRGFIVAVLPCFLFINNGSFYIIGSKFLHGFDVILIISAVDHGIYIHV